MKPIGFVVRGDAGVVNRSEIAADGAVTPIYAGPGREISLNLRQSDIRGYQRLGGNLEITLADGRIVMLEDFFSGDGARLFISADGYLNEVELVEGQDGAVFATYGPTEQWGKWSPSDDLIFLEGTEVAHVAPASDDDVSMLGAGLLGGLGGLGGIGAGAAAILGGGAIIGGGGGGGGGRARIEPSVDQDQPIVIGGDDVTEDEREIVISGTAEPGSEVEVVIGGQVLVTEATGEGTWEVVFEGDTFPGDGSHDVAVTVTEPDGRVTELDGPEVTIDLTGPEIAFDDGTVSAGDMTNGADYEDGVEIGGTGEPGATIEVTIGEVTHETVVGEDGSWGVVFGTGEVAPGEYETTVTVVSTDAFGNSTTVTDTVVIDTAASVAFDGGTVAGDDIVNASEMGAGLTLTGTSEPGSTVVVSHGGLSWNATVAADGSWSVAIAPGDLPGGEYDAEFTVTATDGAGNTASDTRMLRIDTETGVAFDATVIEGDNVVSAGEIADGITLTGTAEPGASVVVSHGAASYTVTAGANGAWSVDFAAGDFAPGEYDATFTVTATDAAGNTASDTRMLRIDTETGLAFDPGQAGGDDLINAAEAAAGVTLTGTAEPGASVAVTMAGVTRTVTAGADGSWSAGFAAHETPTGEGHVTVTAVATDRAGNTSTTSHEIDVDTINMVTVADDIVEGDGVVNAAERADGVVLTGTTQPGSQVTVEMAGASHRATVDVNGNWSVAFAAAEIPEGEYTADVNVTSVDAAGNVASTAGQVEVDTRAGSLALSRDPIEGDNVINKVEASDGVEIKGTSDPGNVVLVELEGATRTVMTGADGTWTAHFGAGDIAPGTYEASITASTVDAAGNSRVVTGTVDVDTEVLNLAIDAAPVEGDDVINAVERDDGVSFTGTVEQGSEVMVSFAGVTHRASVAADGTWRADFARGEIPQGEHDLTLEVDVTDRAGNTASVSRDVRVDTLVRNLAVSDAPIEGDGVINAAEARDGFTLSGTVEAGARAVEVEFDGTLYAATVNAAGNWSVNIPASALATGEYTVDAVVHATDGAGNTDSVTHAIAIDTQGPGAPVIETYTRGLSGYQAISVDMTDDTMAVYEVNHATGGISQLAGDADGVDVGVLGTTTFGFSPAVPDGSHLVVTSTDAAGNTAGTYLVLDESKTSVVDMSNPNLGGLNIEAIDLQFAEESQLTITEAQLTALSGNSDTVVIHGGSDDQVTITGATATGQKVDIDGQMHDVYTLGDTGQLIIDDDIQVTI